MDKEYVAGLERPIAKAPIKLMEIHAIRVNVIVSYIWFLKTIDKSIADDPLQWKKMNFRKWKMNGKPSNATIPPGTLPTVVNVLTSAKDKQQKVDDNMLMGWNRTRKDGKDYPVLKVDEYCT